MTRMVNVLVLPAGGASIRVEKIDGNDYRELNRLVNGNLGTCSIPADLRRRQFYAFCDDDALVRDQIPEPNRWMLHLGHSRLHGPIVLVKTDDEGETRSLSPKELRFLEMYLAAEPTWEAMRAAANEEAWWRVNPSGFSIVTMDDPA